MNSISEPIIVEQIFKVSIHRVWKAITELEEMQQWYFSNIPAFEAKVGFETQFIVETEERTFPHHWKLTEVVPMQCLSYEWQFEGYSGRGVSTFELFEQDHHCKLKLTFTTLEAFPDDISEFKRESGIAGWEYLIKESLREYLEKDS